MKFRYVRYLNAFALYGVLAAVLGGSAAEVFGAEPSSREGDQPQLIVEQVGDRTNIWVESPSSAGGLTRSLLRVTSAEVTPTETGFDPKRRAAFVTWRENDAESWFAFSRDAGDDWTEGRQVDARLAFRDGSVTPSEPLPAPPEPHRLPAEGQVYIVQFRTISLPEWRDSLKAARADLLAYFPNNAHLVRVPQDALERVRALDFVQRIAPYHPWYRLDRRLRDWIEDKASAPRSLRVRAMSFEWGQQAKRGIVEAARRSGAEVVQNTPSGHVVELLVTRDQLRQLAAHDSVMWVDRWSPRETDMDLVREDAGSNWLEDNHGFCGQGVRGEVLDSGIDADHMDFDGRLLHGEHDSSSHGTSTYGIAFGNGDRDGDGSSKGAGLMPCAEAQGIFADYGFLEDRFAHTEELKQAPYYASFQTNSWGNARTRAYNSYSHEMDDIIWRLDIAILQSQSNAGNQDSRPQAWAKNIISVGGIKHRGTLDPSDDEWDFGASTGPAEDGRIKPDVHYWYDGIFTTTTGDDYTSSFGGTSAAAPEVAGVLGLMVQMWSENVWDNDPVGSTVFERQPHFSTMKALLINNAQQYRFDGQDDDLARMHQGWGRPSVKVAKERAETSFIVDEEAPLTLGDFEVYEIDVPPGESELKITMVYPDPPGTTSAAFHRINDLDLKVTAPSDEVYYGNHGLTESNHSQPGGEPNDVDTVENVFVEAPEGGTWLVEISAPEINQDAHLETAEADAAFALVVTGGTSRLVQPAKGRVRMDRETYTCDDRITIRVQDGNATGQSVPVTVSADTEPAGETLDLDALGSDSGEYSGKVSTTSDPPSPGDGVLSVAHGDSITVEYVDADDGSGGFGVPRKDTAAVDCREPRISDVREQNVTDASAVIMWSSDERASSEVIWGESTPPSRDEADLRRKRDHRIELNDLEECTTYYYEVRSEDRFGNLATDDDNDRYHYFETFGDFGNGLQPCHAGRVTIELSTYSCSDSVSFEVSDLDLNTDADVAESTTLEVVSWTETERELVTATETGPDTSTFSGSIPTAVGTPQADGILQVSNDDVVTVTYLDADDGTGRPAKSYDTADVDCHAPRISGVAVEQITDARATVRWTTDEPADSVLEWGVTPELGRTLERDEQTTDHALTMTDLARCDRFFFRVTSRDTHGNTADGDSGGEPFHFQSWRIPGLYYKANFEDDVGEWDLEGEWEIGTPQGKGGLFGSPDPLSAYNNDGVLGVDLSGQGIYVGDYERNSDWSAWSPEFDASGWENLELIYHRELSVHENDEASLWMWTTTRTPLYRNEIRVDEDSYRRISRDISSADGEPSLQFEFYQGSDDIGPYAGWTIDEFILKDGSQPDFASCGGCGVEPSFSGVTDALDNDACGREGVTVSWQRAASWGSGSGGTYSVYRGTSPGFEPSASNRIATGVTGLSHTDTSAPFEEELYYLVRAENDETCGSGPHNGGVLDGNVVYAEVTDTTSQPPPGGVSSLVLEVLGRVHVRLSWPAASHAESYRIYRSTSPEPDSFRELGETASRDFEDRGAGVDGQTYFYDVRAVNACGSEGE